MMEAFAAIKNAESLSAAVAKPGSVGTLNVILGTATPAVSSGSAKK